MISTRTIVGLLMDRGTVTDYAADYGEPGYSKGFGADDDAVVLLGNYWCHCANGPDRERAEETARKNGYDRPHYLHGLECHYPRVFAALESRGCQLEWCDEWVVVNGRAYRTEPDSYSWQRSVVLNPDSCEYLVVGEDPDAWIDFAVNDSDRCLMAESVSHAELESRGFREQTCELENGWYGREDNPAEIFAAIREDDPTADVLFQLSYVEQFRISFCVWVRPADWEERAELEPVEQ